MKTKTEEEIKESINGYRYIKKQSFLGITSLYRNKIGWYRLSDIDNTGYLQLVTLFGSFGVHKFLVGDVLSFLFYLITCGCIGILPASDIISIVNGNYHYTDITYSEDTGRLMRKKEWVYIEKVPISKEEMLIRVALCIFISLIVAFTLYKWIFHLLTVVLVGVARGMTPEQAEIFQHMAQMVIK